MKILAPLLVAFLGSALLPASAQDAAPVSPPEDPYRALEDMARPESQAFFRDQAREARERLDGIPGRAAMLARIRELGASGTSITGLAVTDGRRVFYLKLAPRSSTPVLCVRDSLAGAERVLVDPARFAHGESGAARA